jgi:putative tricarboxylic transport membrane protein
VFLFGIGSFAIRGFRFISKIPKAVLLPSVLILCIYGCYAINNTLFDVGVMFVMGWLGFFMYRSSIPAPPFLIAFILGPLFEDNFRQAMLMSNGDPTILFRSPITWFFWAATLLTIFAISRKVRELENKPAQLAEDNE